MASFDDFRHDDFGVDGVIVPPAGTSERRSPPLLMRSSSNGKPPMSQRALPLKSSMTTIPRVVSPEPSPPPQDLILRPPVRVPSFDDDDDDDDFDDLLLQDQDEAFCASATLYDAAPYDNNDASTTDESDMEAFLEYARDVVAYNNAPYDPKSFHDFEQLLGECIARCFPGDSDDGDKDSLASDRESLSFSGYDHETGTLSYRQQQMLKKPMISKLAANRIMGVIAQKKRDEERALTTINGGFVPPSRSSDNNKTTAKDDTVDSSDDSMVMAAAAAITLHSLKKSRVARERKAKNKPETNSDSDSSGNEDKLRSRPKRPKRGRHMRKTRKEKRNLPPRSRSSKDVNKGTPRSRSTAGGSPASGASISAILSCSPGDKEKVLQYLKEFAPQLYKTVMERMEQEGKAQVIQLERGYHNDSGFLCTPERPLPRGPPKTIVASALPVTTLHKNRLPPSLQTQVPQWIPCIDSSSVIRPSNVKAGITFYAVGASSDLLKETHEQDHVTVSLTEDIERVLQGMLEKQAMMKYHAGYLPQMMEDDPELNHENMAIRGMALIHKFRAKRKAVLQAKFSQQSQEGQTSSVTTPTSLSPPNSTHSGLIEEDKRSPQQLDSYMAQAQTSTSPDPSPTSSLEEQRQKLRRLKENRRRNMTISFQRQESRASLLQSESSPEATDHEIKQEVKREKSSHSSDGMSSMSKASPFRHIKFPLQKKKDTNYEALTPESSRLSVVKSEADAGSDSCSPLLKDSSSNSSLTASSGNNPKNNSFFAGGLKSDDINKIIIDPQSPECLSPIRDYRTWDFSDHSRPFENELTGNCFSDTISRGICDLSDVSSRVPTIFEDNNSSTGHERIPTSTNTSAWSEMSFQSDPVRFPLSSSRKQNHKLTMATGGVRDLSIQVISERIEEVVATESIDICSEYNDSFDEIVSRETPSQNKLNVNDEVSPAAVMDVFFQSQMQCKEKNDFLAFVDDEEELDILFTDKEEDSFVDSSSGSPLQSPVFLTTSRFEI